jgi:uncharacterized protein YcfJ
MKSYQQFLEGYVASADRKAGKDGKLRPARHIKTTKPDDEEEMVEATGATHIVKYHDADGKHVNDSKPMSADKAKAHAEKGNKIDNVGGKYSVHPINEKIDMKKADMADVIKDFQDSDAPQFKGKSMEKRRQMAIAAKMQAKNEELKGNQHKLDKNKNGKLDADDFKKLRKESAHEAMREYGSKHGGIDKTDFHQVAGKLQHHKETGNAGSIHDAAKHIHGMDTDPRDKALDIIKKHDPSMHKSIVHKMKKMNEGVIGAVAGGVLGAMAGPAGMAAGAYLGHKIQKGANKDDKKKVKKEEADQIDELNKDTLSSYTRKASNQAGSSLKHNLPTKKLDNRIAGIKRASKKLDEAKVTHSDQSGPGKGKALKDMSKSDHIDSMEHHEREMMAADKKGQSWNVKHHQMMAKVHRVNAQGGSSMMHKEETMNEGSPDRLAMIRKAAEKVKKQQAAKDKAAMRDAKRGMRNDPELGKRVDEEAVDEAVGTSAKYAHKTGLMGGKYTHNDHAITTKNFSKYRDDRAKKRDAEHKKQDPKMQKMGYAKHMVDTQKAAKKAAEKGADPSKTARSTYHQKNGITPNRKLPENYMMEDNEMEKKEMMKTQLHFIKYAAEEIMEYIDMGGNIEEWYQNKVSKACADFEGLHAYMEGTARKDGLKEATDKPPFDPDPKKKSKPQRNSDGSVTSPMSKAKQLAQKAIQNAEKTVAQHKEGVDFDEEGNLLESKNKITFHQFMGATKKKTEKKGGDNMPLEQE